MFKNRRNFVMLLAFIITASLPLNVDAGSVEAPRQLLLLTTTTTRNQNITSAEKETANEMGLEIINKISDVKTLTALANSGEINIDSNGNLPDFVIVYKTIDTNDGAADVQQPYVTRAVSGLSVTKTDYYDGQYFNDYERDIVYGPCEYTATYKQTKTANWDSSMSASVEVGGSVYGVVDVKGAVSKSMEYTIGKSYEKTKSYKVNIPAGKYWEIKVWTSYRVFKYTVKVGTTTIDSGKSWYPNGLIITNAQYNK